MSDDCWVWFGWICLVGWFAQSNSTLSQRVGMKEVPARKLRGFTGISLQCVPGFRMVQLIRNATAPSVCRDTELTSVCNLFVLMSSESSTQKPSGYPELRDAVKQLNRDPNS